MLCPIFFARKMFLYLIVLLIALTDHGLLADTPEEKTLTPCEQKSVQDIGIPPRLEPCGGSIDCGDNHVIVVRNVTNDEHLLEIFQNVCNRNHSCDLAVATDRRECEIEYYCLNDTYSDTCTYEYFSGIYMKFGLYDNPLPQCYRSDGDVSTGDCSFYPPYVPRNNWLLLQASHPVSINQESNVTEPMESFRNYNFPNNHKATSEIRGIKFNCHATIWLLYMVSSSCDENFDALFLDLDEYDKSPSMYTVPSDDGTIYNTVSSTSTSLGVAYSENGRGNRWMSSRDFILKVTAGIAGGLTLLTFSVCVSVLFKKSSKKTPTSTPPPPSDPEVDADSPNCAPIETKSDSDTSDGEAMYFVIEPEKDSNTKEEEEEENTYNSIDELLPKIRQENMSRRLYNPKWDLPDKTVSTIIEEDMYDHISEDTTQGNTSHDFNTHGSRNSNFSQSSWRRKPCTSHPGSICEDTQSNVPLIPSSGDEWLDTPNSTLRKGSGTYDTILQKNPTASLISTDSESDSDAIYEQVDELCKKSSGYYGSVRPPQQDIYESVDDSPTKMGRCSTFLPPRNEKPLLPQKNIDTSLSNSDTHSQENVEGIYDHLNENWDMKSLRFNQNTNDGHIYAHLGDNFG